MRPLIAAAALCVAACNTDTPRDGANCDRDKWDYACHDGSLFQCRPRTGIWHFMANCGGPAGCSTIRGPPGIVGSYACDALPGTPCGLGYFGPECAPDGSARLDCDNGKVVKTPCPAGCRVNDCVPPGLPSVSTVPPPPDASVP